MALTMYSGIVNSPLTTLTAGITDADVTIPVTELGVFPDAPGLATLGTAEDAETILYAGKSAASGAGNLTGCTREFNKSGTYGAKKAWLIGATISRQFTEYDLRAATTNIANSAPNPFYDYMRLMAGGSMVPTTNPATLDQAETATNKVNYIYGEFTDGGSEVLQWIVDFPEDWDGDHATLGKIIATFIWTATSGAGTVKWVLKGKIFPDDAALDTALAAVGDATDTLITAEDMHISPATTAAVVSPVAAGGKTVVFKVSRDSANDTLNATARLVGIRVKYIRTLVAV